MVRKIVLLILCSFPAFTASSGQVANPALVQDVYTNFLGTWTGSVDFLEDGKFVRSPLQIAITEEPKKGRMRLDYTYGEKGKKGFEQNTRYVVLDPRRKEVVLHWKGEPEEVYHSADPQTFATDGQGEFTAQRHTSDHGTDFDYHGTFRLNGNTLFYQWERSTDGRRFGITGVFTPTRVPPKL